MPLSLLCFLRICQFSCNNFAGNNNNNKTNSIFVYVCMKRTHISNPSSCARLTTIITKPTTITKIKKKIKQIFFLRFSAFYSNYFFVVLNASFSKHTHTRKENLLLNFLGCCCFCFLQSEDGHRERQRRRSERRLQRPTHVRVRF